MRHRLIVATLIMVFVFSEHLFAQDATEEPTSEVISTETPTAEATPDVTESVTTAPTTGTTTPTPVPGETYIVQAGDTLFRIAQRFSTTVSALAQANNIVNPNLIFVGQRLRIPSGGGASATSTAAPATVTATFTRTATHTPVPGAVRYTVRAGDTLFRIAVRNNTTVARLVELNNISNQNLIFVGQVLQLPPGSPEPGTGTATPAAGAATPTPRATAAAPGASVAAEVAYGVVVYPPGQDTAAAAAAVADLGLGWVKLVVSWRVLEPTQGQIDFAALDALVDAFDAQGTQILLTVSTSPDWARTRSNPARLAPGADPNVLHEDGPPDDFTTYATFVGALAEHYAGRVDAYQVWEEPNLGREWNNAAHNIGAESYVNLLTDAYAAIKRADPSALVITAGLAPTEFNDGVNAVADRTFLQAMYANAVDDVSDAIAAHPGGWANPPDSTCCQAPAGVETHYENATFYFRDTLQDYHEIMVANDDNRPLWVTKFGWGTAEDTNPPDADYPFFNYTSLDEQALYTPRAFQLAGELGYIGPMFVNNLNACVASVARAELCNYGLWGPNGQPRPVYRAVQLIEK